MTNFKSDSKKFELRLVLGTIKALKVLNFRGFFIL
jgi:hypothetical protein